MRWLSCYLLCFISVSSSIALEPNRISSRAAKNETSDNTNPHSSFWRASSPIYVRSDNLGGKTEEPPVEVRSRWTKDNLYFLFICPYGRLHLKPGPITKTETQGLWNWDVAEVFIGSDFVNIRHYREFEVSPRGEWTDLDIDLNAARHEDGWIWNSSFTTSARIDPVSHRWFGFMRIPYAKIDSHTATAGNLLRVNFFLSAGEQPDHRSLAWQPTRQTTFHVPEVFGILALTE